MRVPAAWLVRGRRYLRHTRALAGVSAAIGGLAVIAALVPAPAAAAALIPTQIVSMSVSPATLSYPGPQTVTVSGILETTGSPPQPLASQQVVLSYTIGPGQYASDVETGPGGQFSAKISLPAPTLITARFTDTGGYASSSAAAGVLPAQVYPAKIQLNAITPGPAFSTQVVTGTLVMQLPDGIPAPSPYAPISTGGSSLFFTNAQGQFSVPAQVDPGTQVTITAGTGFAWSGSATTGPFYMPLKPEPTWFCGPVGADFPVSPVADIGFGIHVCYETASGATENYSGLEQLYFQPARGGSWQLMATTRTTAQGLAHVTVSGYLADGQLAAGRWKWVVPGSAQFARSASQPFGVVISVPTRIYGIRIVRLGGRHYLAGRLGYLRNGRAVPDARIIVQRRAGRRWRQVAIVRTSSRGAFSYLLRLAGRYRALYRGGRLPGAQWRYGSFDRTVSGSVRFR